MKKLILLLVILLPLAFLFGCKEDKGNQEPKNPVTSSDTVTKTEDSSNSLKSVYDYYPIKQNTRYVYEGKGNEYASYDVYIDYASENKVQQRVSNGGTVAAKVVEIKDGKVTRIFSREEAYYRENFLETTDREEEILLMEPLEKGTTWTLKDFRVRTITDISVNVTTPLGNYNAIEVVTEGTNDKTIDYYAKNVGLVKSVFIAEGSEITSSLNKIEENVSFVQPVRFFYPNISNSKIYYKDNEISFKTNDITRKVLEEAYKNTVANETEVVFSKNTTINSMYLNKDGMVYIDLNKALLNEMNVGALGEQMILQSIANTFGHYYGSQKVLLTIDNELYESGHIAMEKGQYINVKYEDTVEIK